MYSLSSVFSGKHQASRKAGSKRKVRKIFSHGRNVAGTKVARELGHNGVYHTGALNKPSAQTIWAKCWHLSAKVVSFDSRMEEAQRLFSNEMERLAAYHGRKVLA